MNEKLILEKKELRNQIRSKFKSAEGLEIIRNTRIRFDNPNECEKILNQIPAYETAKTISAYLPLDDEFPTEGILKTEYFKSLP